jgi:hypothetical protein
LFWFSLVGALYLDYGEKINLGGELFFLLHRLTPFLDDFLIFVGVVGAVFGLEGFFYFFIYERVFKCYVCTVALLDGVLSFCDDVRGFKRVVSAVLEEVCFTAFFFDFFKHYRRRDAIQLYVRLSHLFFTGCRLGWVNGTVFG